MLFRSEPLYIPPGIDRPPGPPGVPAPPPPAPLYAGGGDGGVPPPSPYNFIFPTPGIPMMDLN